ncbi:rRNA maturation RNase YbeY [Sediminibacterium roseum]|uniref:Endoribonuclease YbeY n=1 Tax=Sediminibacterium roseum TaxID=1978412 RepID=A0ABW9ZTA3_9BACT|nr:rRNA maturation RNase YbeY [Sediminibacterium roseum]NCI48305.1 rRNA maturation RNase YbeY [Sediminibacterium roseum]
MAAVEFRSADRTLRLQERSKLKAFVASIFKKEKQALANITYIFCSDDFLLRMNRDFLKHDYYTDVITFGLSEKGEPVEAEVYISVDRVKDNASNLETTFKAEMLRVIFHGALHLCGYKDKRKSEITLMREREEHYLRLFEKSK